MELKVAESFVTSEYYENSGAGGPLLIGRLSCGVFDDVEILLW
jgi:hypothetical protein